jgi:hypothetical protein
MDILSNNISFRLCGDPKNPGIGIRTIKFTGGCETTGSCDTSGITYTTGYTILDYCTPQIYEYCNNIIRHIWKLNNQLKMFERA